MKGDEKKVFYFQDVIMKLEEFWSERGCIIGQPYNSEVGAGTSNPHTFLRVLGKKPWKVAYVEPSRRPTDGRYGQNPNRLQQFMQFQVILKPSPLDVQDVYIQSLIALGIEPLSHDLRFVEDNWESPTLGAMGLGWEVWIDGLEITQFTYFQKAGGRNLSLISVELTYGLERIVMFIQNKENVFDLLYAPGITYGDIFHLQEVQWSHYNFEEADVSLHLKLFDEYEKECKRLLDKNNAYQKPLVLPAYDFCLKCSHIFNILDARGAISVAERQIFIGKIYQLASSCARAYLEITEAEEN